MGFVSSHYRAVPCAFQDRIERMRQQRWDETIRQFVDRIEDRYGNHEEVEKKRELIKGMRVSIYKELRDDLIHEAGNITWRELVEGAEDAESLRYLRRARHSHSGRPYPQENEERFRVDDDGYVVVYTDGCCLRNGQPDATAGIGVWFGCKHRL